MNKVIRNVQLVAVAFILIATSVAFILEIYKMIEFRTVTLADLLLLFIMAMYITSFEVSRTVA